MNKSNHLNIIPVDSSPECFKLFFTVELAFVIYFNRINLRMVFI